MDKKAEHNIRRKLKILAHAEETGQVAKTCRYWGISRGTFYRWKRDYWAHEEQALVNSEPCPENPSIRVSAVIEEKILYLRTNYHIGSAKISWHMERYLDLKVSMYGVYSVLKRNGLTGEGTPIICTIKKVSSGMINAY